jgi:hypothetical protein
LIQPTNPQERARQVQTEITNQSRDPFAGLQPNVLIVPAASPQPVPSIQPKVSVASPSIPKAQGAPLGFNIPPAVPKSQTAALPPKSQTAALPPKPSTDTAQAVEVTGVIKIGNTPQAIVIAPEDATSRYVGVGQRISNGRVLVKRIEIRDGSEPVVILEENGVEVARSVGEKPAQATRSAG